MDVVGYIRVSSEAQLDGYGLDIQRQAIRNWSKQTGLRVIRICEDRAVSGTKDAPDRPGLTEALDMLRPPPKARGLVVPRLDRLARSLTVQEAILATCWKAGATVYTVDQGEVLQDDEDDPMRTAIRQVQGVFSQLERAMVTKRLRDGRRAKAAAGKHAVGGLPYGKAPGGRGADAQDDPAEMAIVQRVVALRGAGASYRDICRLLEEDGIRPRRAEHWTPAVIRRIALRN